tara:strand:+ start:59 stop:274 length:216 start_codon:yes stop_codon:yes gene_type:complete
MNCEIKGGHKTLTKKGKQRAWKKEPYYIPVYGTADCSYKGKKRGRKSKAEKKLLAQPILKVDKKSITIYFD